MLAVVFVKLVFSDRNERGRWLKDTMNLKCGVYTIARGLAIDDSEWFTFLQESVRL